MSKIFIFLFFTFSTFAQTGDLKIAIPNHKNWNFGYENQKIEIPFAIKSDSACFGIKFEISEGKLLGMAIDSNGIFTWTPDFETVDKIAGLKNFPVSISASNKNKSASLAIDLRVQHINRKPIVAELRPFYIRFNENNVYKILKEQVYDPDGGEIVIVPTLESLPEGMSMSSQGEITWKPSFHQFKQVKDNPWYLEFNAFEKTTKLQTSGKLKLEVTQMDLPPVITMIPKNEYIKVKENQNLSFKFFLSDPNGDDDIELFDFLSSNTTLNRSNLIKKEGNQYEFSWTPNYDFVQDPADSLAFDIDFFVLDKAKKREVLTLKIVVVNSINELEKDKKNYNQYFGTLTRAWELMEQLKEKEEELKKAYKKARKGKKHRSVLNASLGATTGLSSIFSKKSPETQRMISTIGGTTVLTIGTLEATEVIGRSMKDLVDRLNYIIEKKNELQTKGDIFARDYASKSSRRNPDFIRKVDDFMSSMSLKGLVAFELKATWESKSKPEDINLKKTFPDFIAW